MYEDLITDIKNDLKLSLFEFREKDFKDFETNDSERAKVFRIGYYLQKIMDSKELYKKEKIIVDCEYNRMVTQDGRVAKNMPCMKDDDHNGNVIPDLIVHRRNSSECNLLVCEFKNKHANDRDEQKLDEFKKSKFFQYKHACLIILNKLHDINYIENLIEKL